MSRYIDADAFIEDIKNEAMNLFMNGLKGTPRPRKELYDIMDRIEEQPTADVVEVRHGEWKNSGFCSSLKTHFLVKCSKCDFGHILKPYLGDYDGKVTFGEFILNTHYCQNCGAKMDGEKKEE